MQQINPNAPFSWVAGFSFGSWIAMQLLMRRPELVGFIAGSTPANLYDFSFLAPCPSSGVILHAEHDKICVPEETRLMAERTRTQKGRKVEFQVVPDADHFFESHMDAFLEAAEAYLDRRLEHENPEGEYFEPV